MLKRLLVTLVAAFIPVVAMAAPITYYVRPAGNDQYCNGKTNADWDGTSSTNRACAYKTLTECNTTGSANGGAKLVAGDSCIVAAGLYGGSSIIPDNTGLTASRITYQCASGTCTIRPSGTNALDLRGKSSITVDGFTFEGGTIPWGNGSVSNIVKNFVVQGVGGVSPGFETDMGCGFNNTLDTFTVNVVGDTGIDGMVVGWTSAGCSSMTHDQSPIIKNGIIRGGNNGIEMDYCDLCTVDNVLVTGAWNHTFTVGYQSVVGGLTVKNSKFMASTKFREPILDFRQINGLTFSNNFVDGFGEDMPGHNFTSGQNPATAIGAIHVRNNVFVNYGSQIGEFTAWIQGTSATWDFDYNAYVQKSGGGSTPSWKRDSSNYYGDQQGDGSTDSDGASDFDDWQALGFDQHSVWVVNKDYRKIAASYNKQLYGTSGATWGAVVQCVGADSDGTLKNEFDTTNQWQEGLYVGDKIEYNWDGTIRTIVDVDGTMDAGTCGERKIKFTPAIDSNADGTPENPSNLYWFLSWGRQDPGGDGTIDLATSITAAKRTAFIPVAGSPLIDSGDDGACGHPFAPSSHCDMGPTEGPVGSDTHAPALPTNLAVAQTAFFSQLALTWTKSRDDTNGDGTVDADATGYNVFRSATDSDFTLLGTTTDGNNDGTVTFLDTTGPSPATYYYQVSAFDVSGNVSAQTASVNEVMPDLGSFEVVETPANGASPNIILQNACTGTVEYSTDAHQGARSANMYLGSVGNMITGSSCVHWAFPVNKDMRQMSSVTFWVKPADAAASDMLTNGNAGTYWSNCPTNVVAGTGALYSYQAGFMQVYTLTDPLFDELGNHFANVRCASCPPGLWTKIVVPRSSFFAATSPWGPIPGGPDVTWANAHPGEDYGIQEVGIEILGCGTVTSGSPHATTSVLVDDFQIVTTGSLAAPTTPDSLTASAQPGDASMSLSWNSCGDDIGVIGYEVERQIVGGANFIPVADTPFAWYLDGSVTAGASYNYRVRAYDAQRNKSAWGYVAATMPAADPVLGEPFSVAAAQYDSTADGTDNLDSISVSWSAPPSGATPSSYTIYRSITSGGGYEIVAEGQSSPYVDFAVTGGVTYYYYVRGVTSGGLTGRASVEVAQQAVIE